MPDKMRSITIIDRRLAGLMAVSLWYCGRSPVNKTGCRALWRPIDERLLVGLRVMKKLIIEDDKLLREGMQQALEQESFAYECADIICVKAGYY